MTKKTYRPPCNRCGQPLTLSTTGNVQAWRCDGCGHMARHTPLQRALHNLLAQGYAYKAIGKALGVPSGFVRQWVRGNEEPANLSAVLSAVRRLAAKRKDTSRRKRRGHARAMRAVKARG